jgi:DNA invertase Pin-like site-specific DNA recombinase
VARTVLFLAETKASPTIAEQRARCAEADDIIIEAGRISFADLTELNERRGIELKPGDTLKIYDFNCLLVTTGTLIRALVKFLKNGITIVVHAENVVFHPDSGEPFAHLLTMLDEHRRKVHGAKTHGPTYAGGRKKKLNPSHLPKIRRQLKARTSLAQIAAELGVSRTTLYGFLKEEGEKLPSTEE